MFFFTMVNLWCFLLLFLGGGFAQEAPRGCERRGNSLACRLRTIGTAKSVIDFLPTSVAAKLPSLHLICSDVLFFESTLEQTSRNNESSDFLGQLKRLTDLQIDYCKIRVIPTGVFSHLTDLRNLALRTHNNDWSAMMMELMSGSFSGLSELRQLDLSDNNIWTLPPEVFCPLYSLKTLNLTRNRIQDMTQLGLSDWGKVPIGTGKSCNTALEALDLSENDIIAVPDNGLSSLRSLTTLQLQENAISSMGDRALVGLSALQILNVSCNYIVSLPPELFQFSQDVKQIYINNNSLSVLAPGLFDGLDQLQVLDLSHNELSSRWVNKDTFSGLVRMVVLNLAHNVLTKIDSAVFRDLYSLQFLTLEHNKIETISESAFAELKNLHALTLSHNSIKVLEAYHFSELYVLNLLSLDHNSIDYIHHRTFENVTNINDLDLSGNDLRKIPSAIRNLRTLKSLDLGKNNISQITNASFEGLDQLFGLRLVANNISKIHVNSFKHLHSLAVLNMASNFIDVVERGSFNFNPKLQAIRLDGNKLSEVSGIFGELRSLVWLNISDNNIQWFDYNDLPPTLQWLDIHGNQLQSLPQCANAEQIKLKMLDASYNNLREITGNVIPTSIEVVYLNHNNISFVGAATFIGKNNLEKVVLNNNNIQTMEYGALALTSVEEGREMAQFYISGNPYKCDCTMEWLQRFNELVLTRQHPRVMDLEAVTCSLTHSRGTATKTVLELKSSQFLCPYEAHCFALCHCCDFDACDCEMTCPQNCTCYHDLTWTANVVDCSNAGYTEVPAKIPMDATEIYLDGNDLKELGSHVFIGKKKLQVLYLNNSNLQSVHNRTFKGVESLKILHLENNKIQELRGDEFDQLHNLNELYLDHNGISRVGNNTFVAMKNLEVLRLDENKIVNFSPWQYLASSSGSLSHVSLEGNKWSCDCRNIVKLESWLRSNPGDPEKMFCSSSSSRNRETIASVLSRCINYMDNTLATSVEQREVYSEPTFIGQNYISIFAGVFILVILICMFGALIFAFRQDVRLWAHSKYGVRLFKDTTATNIAELDGDRLYDAYLIYSVKDEDFVTRVISSELEQTGYSVCLHYRDIHMMTGNSYLADSIASTTDASKRIVVILTINFLTLEWMNQDLRTSLLSTLKSLRLASKTSKMIFVLTTDVSALNLDADLQLYLRSHGVFYWGEKRFWEKFRFAMPDVSSDKSKRDSKNTSVKNLPAEVRKCSNLRYTASPLVMDNCQRFHQTLPPPGLIHHSAPSKGPGYEPESSSSYNNCRDVRHGFASTGRASGHGGNRDPRGRTYFV